MEEDFEALMGDGDFETPEEPKVDLDNPTPIARLPESTPEVDDTPVYEFDEEVHPPGEEPRQVQLTKEDLNPRNDPKLKVLFEFFESEDMEKYFKMPSLRGLKNHIKATENALQTDFANYKKRGRI